MCCPNARIEKELSSLRLRYKDFFHTWSQLFNAGWCSMPEWRFKQRHKPCQRSWIWPPSPNTQFSQALPTANIFRRCLLCSECCWTTRHFASPWSSHVWESFSTCSSSRRCSYEQIHPHHLQSTNIYKLFYKSTYTKARNVFVSLSAHLCEWVYQCITVCLLHPVALFVCRWVSPFTSCNMLMCFKNGCFAMLCWHGWREQLSKSDQFSQQVSVPKLVLSTFTSVLRGTICSSCHARPQNLTGHLNGG